MSAPSAEHRRVRAHLAGALHAVRAAPAARLGVHVGVAW